MLIFVTVYHDACIENLLLRLILFTFRIKLKGPPPLRQMSDFTLSPPILAAILCYAPPPSGFRPPLLIIIAQSLRKYPPHTDAFISRLACQSVKTALDNHKLTGSAEENQLSTI